jgi:3-oxoacyl-[acyl-carrier-protein] synthase-3
MVETSDEWITSRTGIKERRICTNGESQTDLCMKAGTRALEMAGIRPSEVDYLIVATVTPDYRLPSSSCIVQKKLGLVNAATFDLVAACSGFLYGMATADAFIRIGKYKKILVIGAEHLTSMTDFSDRNTCVLFGDGAGAALFEPSDNSTGVLSTYMMSDGRLAELLWIPEGGSRVPVQKTNPEGDIFIKMEGKEVFKHAVRQMVDASRQVLRSAELTADGVDILIPHQANIRILKSTAKRLGIPMENVFVNIEKYGNTSAASVPIALDEAYRGGLLNKGDIILMTSFGGGLTWSAAVVRW